MIDCTKSREGRKGKEMLKRSRPKVTKSWFCQRGRERR